MSLVDSQTLSPGLYGGGGALLCDGQSSAYIFAPLFLGTGGPSPTPVHCVCTICQLQAHWWGIHPIDRGEVDNPGCFVMVRVGWQNV